ncbi:hypothetical protein AYI69_g11288 [Smittium culicis]|uniref:Uncharacterized protein n=1 Tax=Smittium culicis TaxID=133412 RepID=A0A1R1WZS0_9FUNG|nr:hypothetical protein AYI69_g11288 [Smittium culicis]
MPRFSARALEKVEVPEMHNARTCPRAKTLIKYITLVLRSALPFKIFVYSEDSGIKFISSLFLSALWNSKSFFFDAALYTSVFPASLLPSFSFPIIYIIKILD